VDLDRRPDGGSARPLGPWMILEHHGLVTGLGADRQPQMQAQGGAGFSSGIGEEAGRRVCFRPVPGVPLLPSRPRSAVYRRPSWRAPTPGQRARHNRPPPERLGDEPAPWPGYALRHGCASGPTPSATMGLAWMRSGATSCRPFLHSRNGSDHERRQQDALTFSGRRILPPDFLGGNALQRG
jgi:hypothetical protein